MKHKKKKKKQVTCNTVPNLYQLLHKVYIDNRIILSLVSIGLGQGPRINSDFNQGKGS